VVVYLLQEVLVVALNTWYYGSR